MKKKSFTLLELMIVTFILAILAGGVVVSLGGAREYVQDSLQQYEVSEIQKAIIAFRKDTGSYPKTGSLEYAKLDFDITESDFDDERNFVQLFKMPKVDTDSDLDDENWKWTWNIDSKRGWKGPYLNPMIAHIRYSHNGETHTERYLDITNGIRYDDNNGDGKNDTKIEIDTSEKDTALASDFYLIYNKRNSSEENKYLLYTADNAPDYNAASITYNKYDDISGNLNPEKIYLAK